MASLHPSTNPSAVYRMQCAHCSKWHTVDMTTYDDFFMPSCEEDGQTFECSVIERSCHDEHSLAAVLTSHLSQAGLDVTAFARPLFAETNPFPNKVPDSDINPDLYAQMQNFGYERCKCCGDWVTTDERDKDTNKVCGDDEGCLGQQHHDDMRLAALVDECYNDDGDYTKCEGCNKWTHCDHIDLNNEDFCEDCAPEMEAEEDGEEEEEEEEEDDDNVEGVYVEEPYFRNGFITAPFGKVCSSGHVLVQFQTPNSSFACDICNFTQVTNMQMYGCNLCNYDLCYSCTHQHF